MSDGVRLEAFDAGQAQKFVEELVAVYREIYEDPADEFHTEDRYRRQLAGHMCVSDWKLVTARQGDELIGYAYGFPLPPTTRWWQGLLTKVPDDFAEENGRRTFAISEIMVRAPWRSRGVASALHVELLNGRTEERVTLLVERDNNQARSIYTKWGYQRVASLRPSWHSAPLFDVLILPND